MRKRWRTGQTRYILAFCLTSLLIYHAPLFSYAFHHIDHHSPDGWITLALLAAIVFITGFILLALIGLVSARLLKAFVVFSLLASAVALYFVNTYGVILDKGMMGNVFNTRSTEAFSFLSPKLALYVVVWGLAPAWLFARLRIERGHRLRLARNLLISVVLALALVLANGGKSLWFDNHSKHLGGVIMPWSFLINSARIGMDKLSANRKQTLLPDGAFADDRKMVVVLIIGESARADHFSLYGYGRKTNPLLEQENMTVLPNSRSCATYTTAAVHCILSASGSSSDTTEPLPSYLHRLGADVIWRTHNWGQPPLQVDDFHNAGDLSQSCSGENCQFDEVLLTGLDKRIASSTKNKIFVVLHMSGSHGPRYYQKYPARFEKFSPVCKSVELHECTRQSLINAYDNSILYTDYFIKRVIDLLGKQPSPALMLYLSDHGESLGEHGLYLHGAPNAIAPREQRNIPFLVWQSANFPWPYAPQRKNHSQSEVFHTILGAFGVNSSAYDQSLDLFSRP